MCSFSLTSFYSFRCCYCWRFCCCFCWCFSCWYCCLLHFIVAFSRALFRSVVYLLSAYCINERHWATKPPRNVGTRARGCSVARQSIVLSPVLGVNRTNTHVQTFNSNNNNRKEKKHQIQTHTKLYWNSANEQKKKECRTKRRFVILLEIILRRLRRVYCAFRYCFFFSFLHFYK